MNAIAVDMERTVEFVVLGLHVGWTCKHALLVLITMLRIQRCTPKKLR
jgi:hypothetical protein